MGVLKRQLLLVDISIILGGKGVCRQSVRLYYIPFITFLISIYRHATQWTHLLFNFTFIISKLRDLIFKKDEMRSWKYDRNFFDSFSENSNFNTTWYTPWQPMFGLHNTPLSCSHISIGDAEGCWNCPRLIILFEVFPRYYNHTFHLTCSFSIDIYIQIYLSIYTNISNLY